MTYMIPLRKVIRQIDEKQDGQIEELDKDDSNLEEMKITPNLNSCLSFNKKTHSCLYWGEN